MFPLHQSNELCFQISPNPRTILSEDLFLGHENNNNSASIEDQTNGSDAITNQIESGSNPIQTPNNDNKNKKMKHRDIERQRRQEMASLHASLRSLLPLHLIKGKRSMSDHINESAKYIKQLQVKIKELGSKRDELKVNFSAGSEPFVVDRSGSDGSTGPVQGRFTVQPCSAGVEISFSTTGCFGEGNIGNLPLSRVLKVILGEGLNVVACVSTKVNGMFLHTIKSEASDKESIDLSALEQKLKEVLFHSSNRV